MSLLLYVHYYNSSIHVNHIDSCVCPSYIIWSPILVLVWQPPVHSGKCPFLNSPNAVEYLYIEDDWAQEQCRKGRGIKYQLMQQAPVVRNRSFLGKIFITHAPVSRLQRTWIRLIGGKMTYRPRTTFIRIICYVGRSVMDSFHFPYMIFLQFLCI